ncbi:InlB B-repeat-containing protein, partial [Candidatus Saccharibacteria bacterium]|nr:InlB B-repeat-containing protein [Candidatus Saccharibacteria bacterium]
SGYAYNFYLATGGALTNNGRIDTAYGIRPVISLKHGATIGGGDGTATSPWTLAKYTISFNANGGSGTMSSQTVYNGFEIPLSSNTFTAPTNKIFLNWNTAADGSGTNYGNGESVTDLAMAGGSVTLYAQWIEGTYIQDFTNAMCQSQASSSNAIVYDARDGSDYTVRYINGNCWMTQNLRFTGNSFDSTTSNVASTYTASSPLILNWHELKEADRSGGVCVPSLEGYTAPCRRVPDAADLAEIGDTADNVGVWYNYVGATVGTITGTSTAEDVYNVCPKNWTLPTQAQQNSVVSYVSAFSPVLSGAYNPDFKDGMSILITGGSQTAIWSSTAADNNIFPYRYYILGNNSSLSVSSFKTGDPANTYFGYTIRCIRKN